MRGVFDDEEPAPARQGHDTELTLGSGMLLAIFFGLVLVCGVCFGLGYAVGHRGATDAAAASATPGTAATTPQADGSRAKPSASAVGAVQPAPSAMADLSASAELPASAELAASAEAATSSGGQNSAAAVGSAPAGQALVRPALPAVGIQGQATQAGAVTPAMGAGSASGLMVQIAAVTNQEDADVLMSALRKRGYAVAARRDAADGMIHVRTGPFNSRDEAEKWRQRLLNDGYNAIVQP